MLLPSGVSTETGRGLAEDTGGLSVADGNDLGDGLLRIGREAQNGASARLSQ